MNLSIQLEKFSAGELDTAYELLGAHFNQKKKRWCFRVWAPQAKAVSVVGDFNFWNPEDLPMQPIGEGIWQAESSFARLGQCYKYCVTHQDGSRVYKTDPYGYQTAVLPETSSVLCSLDYTWQDGAYRRAAARQNVLKRPVNIYEVHLGSWKRHDDGSYYSYRELAETLVPYAKQMGYTHLELLPLTEYPYDPSWGYQVTCYYAPTFRYGTPQELMYFIDTCHAAGLGVILDWVPAHFPKDENGLYEFDGTCLYELSDPAMNEHPDWGTRIFDYGKGGVVSFLVSNVLFWLTKYHIDGIRVDAVASMLYLDYNRPHFKPNRYGGRENLEAIAFLQKLNIAAFGKKPNVLMIAEESTAFPKITRPVYEGGLGFLFKWNMGWMNDLLSYMSKDPVYRKYEHNKLTFQLTYAFSENFILPLSHDEVVHGKCSLIGKMPGEYDQKFANLRAFFGYMMTEPGKKLNFMGSEFAQFIEWNYTQGLDWLLLDYDRHRQMQAYVKALNHFYLDNPCLWENEQGWDCFAWLEPDDCDNSILSYRRIGKGGKELLVLCNFCPCYRDGYLLGLPRAGTYDPVFCSDAEQYGGCGTFVPSVKAKKKPRGAYAFSGEFTLPAMSVTIYRRRAGTAKSKKTPLQGKRKPESGKSKKETRL